MDEPTIAGRAPIAVELGPDESCWWCSCGKSADQPRCDGSHKGSSFRPVKATKEGGGEVWLCTCKHTSTPPFCDGTHKSLP